MISERIIFVSRGITVCHLKAWLKYAGSVTRGCTCPGRLVALETEVLTVAPRFLEKPRNIRLGCGVCGERLARQEYGQVDDAQKRKVLRNLLLRNHFSKSILILTNLMHRFIY